MNLAETDPATSAEDWRAAGFGVYVHWPFCLAKCPYCDFNSHVSATVNQTLWRAKLVEEVAAARRMSGPRAVDTVFFGGGTPSLMPPETVAAIIEAIDAAWGLNPALKSRWKQTRHRWRRIGSPHMRALV